MRIKFKNKSLYILLIISLILNVAYFKYDTVDYLWPKIEKKYFKQKTLTVVNKETEEIILKKAIQMVKSPNVAMIWDDPKGLTHSIITRNSNTTNEEFRKFNYPRAFLYFGLTEYLMANKTENNHQLLLAVKDEFDKLIINNHKFQINRVDQAPFGITSLNLYVEFNVQVYKDFADEMFNYLKNVREGDIIFYRKNQNQLLNDVLGMTIPFLVKYYHVTGNPEALEIAKTQLSFYIKYGVDKETLMPAHAIDRSKKIKTGSINWGRGIGWYFIALSNYHRETGDFENEFTGLKNTLNKSKNSENLWSQFIGVDETFDASPTSMYMYGMLVNNPKEFSKLEMLNLLKPYLSLEGELLHTSGDTYGLNRYSQTFGKSELSQGMLLLALSTAKE